MMLYCEYDEFDHYQSGQDYSRAAFEMPHMSLPLDLAPEYAGSCLCCGASMHGHFGSAFSCDLFICQTLEDVCNRCGFWYHWDMAGGDWSGTNVYLARLKKLDLADKEAPYRQIVSWLTTHPNDVYYVHPRRFEEVVGGILGEFIGCEFAMTAESADGGVDLIAYDSDVGKILVEVKRYSASQRVGVRLVRHLAGVLVRENVMKGLLVATTDFTSPAQKEIKTLRRATQDYPLSINLVRFNDLLPWLQVVHKKVNKAKRYSKSYWDAKLAAFREDVRTHT